MTTKDEPTYKLAEYKFALKILAAIVGDATHIMPDEYYGRKDITRQDAWCGYALRKAREEIELEKAKAVPICRVCGKEIIPDVRPGRVPMFCCERCRKIYRAQYAAVRRRP